MMIRGEEPHSGVSIEHPFAPALGIAELRFEGPAIGPPVNQLGGIVLAGRSYHLEPDAEQDLLMPFHELLRAMAGPPLRLTERR